MITIGIDEVMTLERGFFEPAVAVVRPYENDSVVTHFVAAIGMAAMIGAVALGVPRVARPDFSVRSIRDEDPPPRRPEFKLALSADSRGPVWTRALEIVRGLGENPDDIVQRAAENLKRWRGTRNGVS